MRKSLRLASDQAINDPAKSSAMPLLWCSRATWVSDNRWDHHHSKLIKRLRIIVEALGYRVAMAPETEVFCSHRRIPENAFINFNAS
jgi:hypothetical protein